MRYICYSLTQKFLGILFTTSSLCQFLHNSILYHLICDFHTCNPRPVGRSPLRLKGSWCSQSFHSGSGTPLSFEITEIQHMSLHHFKPCLLQGPFSAPFLSSSGSFLLWGVTAHIFSSIHFGTYRLCKHTITIALHRLLITFMCLTCAASILYLIYLHHIKQIPILDHSLDPMFIYTSVYSTSPFGSLIGVSNLLQSKKLLYIYPLKSVHHIAFLSQFLEAPSFQLFMPNTLDSSFCHTPCLIHHKIISPLSSKYIQHTITSTSIAITFVKSSSSLSYYNAITKYKLFSLISSCNLQPILKIGARRYFENISQIMSFIFPNGLTFQSQCQHFNRVNV